MSESKKIPTPIAAAPSETISFGPSRPYSGPAMKEASANVPIIGSRPAPDFNGL